MTPVSPARLQRRQVDARLPGVLTISFVGTLLIAITALSVWPAPLRQASMSAESESRPTFPDFTCADGMDACNEAELAGLYSMFGYGRGAAWVDVDGDGWDDLFLADCDNRWDANGYGVSMFFLNRQDGTFRAVPATELGIRDEDLNSTWSGSFSDFDNDGDQDVLLVNGGYSGVSNLALYENRFSEDGTFRSVTAESGIEVANVLPSNWWGASWADYDSDGRLDVVVTRTDGRALLFHNDDGQRFTEMSEELGVGVEMEDGKNPVWIDHDADGDPDLYLAGMWQHAFYRNDGGRFFDITGEIFAESLPLPGPPIQAPPPIVFAAAAEDFNQDGLDDLYFGRFDIQDVLLINDGNGGFRYQTTDWGLAMTNAAHTDFSREFENTMGLGVGDLDDDGYPDVFVGTGNPLRAAPDVVFCNQAGDALVRCTGRVFPGVARRWATVM